MPDATAAPEPPEEPPGVRSVSHGLRVGPKRFGSVTGRIPISGMFVRPTITKPASLRRRTRKASCSGTKSPNRFEPKLSGRPAAGISFLSAIGTPANGRASPAPIPSAVASARSAST